MKSNLLRQVKTSSHRSKIMNKVALATQTSSCYLHTMSVDVLEYDCDTPPGLCFDFAALSKAQLGRFNGFPYTHRMVASLDRTTRHPLSFINNTLPLPLLVYHHLCLSSLPRLSVAHVYIKWNDYYPQPYIHSNLYQMLFSPKLFVFAVFLVYCNQAAIAWHDECFRRCYRDEIQHRRHRRYDNGGRLYHCNEDCYWKTMDHYLDTYGGNWFVQPHS